MLKRQTAVMQTILVYIVLVILQTDNIFILGQFVLAVPKVLA